MTMHCIALNFVGGRARSWMIASVIAISSETRSFYHMASILWFHNIGLNGRSWEDVDYAFRLDRPQRRLISL